MQKYRFHLNIKKFVFDSNRLCQVGSVCSNIEHVVTSIPLNKGSNYSMMGVTSVFTRGSSTGRYCRARISYGDSVCLSVCLSGVSRPGTESSPGEIETPGFHHMVAWSL